MARSYTKKPSTTTNLTTLATDCTGLYIRVSTEKQAEEGNSLEAQRETLTKRCESNGWKLCEEYIFTDEGLSGKQASNRPALQRMLEAVRTGQVNRIVATKFDRLARNTRDLLDIVEVFSKAGCALVLLDLNIDTGTATGQMITTIMGSLAEWERKLIKERVMSGKQQQASKGEYNGSRIPLGYFYNKSEGEFTINKAQAPIIRRIFELFLAGHSLRAIARILNEDSTPTATGKGEWNAYGISHILRNGIYAGIMQWDGKEVNDKLPSIISREVYDQAQTLITGRGARVRVDLLKGAE